jgi:hypothetical protein
MKVTNWCKELTTKLIAAGVLLPSAAYAQTNIPLGDPSFEAYVVPASPGYAYANNYRPTSDWIDDPGPPPGYTTDNVASNWLYDAAYAESTTFTKRPAPRTGNQAMHGLFNYSGQESGAVFEANHTYTFSLWAQNDVLLNETNGVFMYIYDGTIPFSDANSLANALYEGTDINQRQQSMTAADSAANWSLITVSHYVAAGAPEIGNPVGVAFFSRKDSAVDDASLSVVPEPMSVAIAGLGIAGVTMIRRRRHD